MLEVGCGVGAQTITLAVRSPGARFTAVDVSADSGRQLYPLMVEAGFDPVRVSPRVVYVDSSRPNLVDGFTRKTFTAMIEGIREPAIAAGLIARERFDAGVRDLHRTKEADGVFCYTFFKPVRRRRAARRVSRS